MAASRFNPCNQTQTMKPLRGACRTRTGIERKEISAGGRGRGIGSVSGNAGRLGCTSQAPSPRRYRRRHPVMRRISGAARRCARRRFEQRRRCLRVPCDRCAAAPMRLAGEALSRAWPTTTTSASMRAAWRRPAPQIVQVRRPAVATRGSTRERSCIGRAAAASSGSGPWPVLLASMVGWYWSGVALEAAAAVEMMVDSGPALSYIGPISSS